MKITCKEYDELGRRESQLHLDEWAGRISVEEFSLKSDKLLDELLSFENVSSYPTFKEFVDGFSDSLLKAYNQAGIMLPYGWRGWVLEEAKHEREHFEASQRYGITPSYGLLHQDTPLPRFWQPFTILRSADILEKGWDRYMRFRHLIDVTSAPKVLSPGDKESLRILGSGVRLQKEFTQEQRGELLRMVHLGLRK